MQAEGKEPAIGMRSLQQVPKPDSGSVAAGQNCGVKQSLFEVFGIRKCHSLGYRFELMD
jgi:hypothetical protein